MKGLAGNQRLMEELAARIDLQGSYSRVVVGTCSLIFII